MKIKRVIKSLIVFLVLFTLSFNVFGCKKENYTFNHDYLFGLCDPTGEIGSGFDKDITNEWLGDICEVMGVKSYRLWINMDWVINVNEDNSLSFNPRNLNATHGYIDNLKRAGVENFIMMYSSFLYPYGSNLKGYDVPDINENAEEYLAFLKINAEGGAMMAREFPDIDVFEVGNEADLNGMGLHKHGYKYGADVFNHDYIFTDEELACIIGDMCWYIRRAVKSVDEKNKVALPGLSLVYDSEYEFFEGIYEAIESKKLPFGNEDHQSDLNPDNYFDYLCWHPYMRMGEYAGGLDFSEEDWQEWADQQIGVHEIAVKHGDAEKPAIFSEFGWTDAGATFEGELQQQIAKNYTIAYDIIKEQMPWVEAVCVFRGTTLETQDAGITENNFGLFYNKNNTKYGKGAESAGKAKPSAKALTTYFNNTGCEHFNDFNWLENKYAKN